MWSRCLLLSVFVSSASAENHRGVWFWGSTTLPGGGSSPFGSSVVVGDGTAEDETVAFFTSHDVKRLYGSYQNRPVSEPSVIAAWNAKLDAAGVNSQILIDGNAVNDPAEITSILGKITNRLINFNNSQPAASRFDALHLDLEPQGLPEWDSGTPADKRDLLDDLLQAYTDIRAHLDTAGFTTFPIYADIPFSWDKLPVDGGSIGWTDATDRDNWFADVDAQIDGVSVMTFSKDNFADLADATEYERTGPLAEARVAIQPKCGPGELWPSLLHINAVIHQLETNLGPTEAVDLENYAFWRHAIETCGVTVGPPIIVSWPVSGTGALPWPPTVGGTGGVDGDDPVLVFPGYADKLHIIHTAADLRGPWQELIRLRTSHPNESEMFRVPVPAQGPRRFWMLETRTDGGQ
ncbi:MAG: hypothetical protein H7A49_09705 [Akkermansiaceae bacterium]|nr:hypothetical protein [Akkermansiaceae bacterium]MCP5544168.1 hypothetical protein [Akkermansiaceae bacterium]MCP5549253.1 hypothetical protein [Akkermansiaceae bacterium]